MKLGDHIKDKITGFEGIATGVANYITGCRQWHVASRTLKPDGDSIGQWIDEIRLDVVPGKQISLGAPAENPGGPSLGPGAQIQSTPPRG